MDKTQVKVGSLLRESIAHELQGKGLISSYWVVQSATPIGCTQILTLRSLHGEKSSTIGMKYFIKSSRWKLES